MRIISISVTNLFGMFNYDIPLNLNKRATIIIGPNGYGKTTILKMIDGVINGNFSIINKVPFQNFIIKFQDRTAISITKGDFSKKEKKGETEVKIEISKGENKMLAFSLNDFNFETARELYVYLNKYFREGLDYPRHWLMRKGEDIINSDYNIELFDRIIQTYSKRNLSFDNNLILEFLKEFPSFSIHQSKAISKYLELISAAKVHFVKTNRLISFSTSEKSTKEEPVVKIYAAELAKEIETTLARSMQLAQKLDSSFPGRVINKPPQTGGRRMYKKLITKLNYLREKRINLRDSGILVDLGDDIIPTEEIEDGTRINYLNGVLIEYIKDTQEKLKIFDDLAKKIDLLKNIFKDKFKFKILTINKDQGIVFKTNQGEMLNPEDLSSGEQHELVMFYEFLFRVPKGSLVLIDEPELSLHIAWQQKFLTDIIDIAKIVGFDVLVATHAPSIINEYWNLTVDLGDMGNASHQ